MDWSRYASIVAEYDRLTEHARDISKATVGIIPQEEYLRYGELIFVKLLAHCITLRSVVPDPARRNAEELWDLGSASAIARSIVEAYDAMAYIALGIVSAEERTFRIMLWELHDVSRRIKMLAASGSSDPQYIKLLTTNKLLKSRLKDHSYFSKVEGSFSRKINDEDPPPYHLSQRDRCKANRINFDYYNVVTMQLSQYVHTLPISVHQLMHFKAGSPGSLRLMSGPLQYSMAFLSRALEGMSLLFPHVPRPPTDVGISISVWSSIAEQGIKKVESSSIL